MDEDLEYTIRPRTSFKNWTDEEIKEHKKAQQSKCYKNYYQRKKTEKNKLMYERDEAYISLATETDEKEYNDIIRYIEALDEEISSIPFK